MVRHVCLVAAVLAASFAAGCADTCDDDADCPADATCDSGVCVRDASGGGGGTETPCADADADGACDADDDCPGVANANQEDADGDRQGDACDPCPADPADDADRDGVCGDVDVCPDVSDPAQADLDGDGRGDACDEDDDGDGTPDADDCAPADPAVHPGADDPCDFVDTDCQPYACRFPVTALGEAQRAVDLACLRASRRCAVVTAGPDGAGSLLFLDLGEPVSLRFGVSLPAPRGVNAELFEGRPIAWVAGADGVRALELDDGGATIVTLSLASAPAGPLAASWDGNSGVAALEGSRILLFDPTSLLTGGDEAVACGGAERRCQEHDLATLVGPSGALGERRPHRLAYRIPGANGTPTAYLSFDDDDRLAVLVIGSGLQPRLDLSGLLEPALAAPTELAFDAAADRLFALGGDGAGARVRPGPALADHAADGFVAPAAPCPTAVAATSTQLFVGDAGGDAGPRLLSFDLDEDGLPLPDDHRVDPLPGCRPARIAPLPPVEGTLTAGLAIACAGGTAVVVLGRD